uniref:Uncharacterized protein n=1 Tax=Meloidogyne enterolobii TaxID=390850 RepID=A0A6V7VKS8_MELEN|nr:unnamed protein product [Meloidogyne enterolobii]
MVNTNIIKFLDIRVRDFKIYSFLIFETLVDLLIFWGKRPITTQ